MPAIFIHNGDFIDHIPTADVPLGAVVVQGSLVGIAQRPIPAGAIGALALTGVYDLPAATGTTASVGASLYWDATAQNATTNPGAGVNAPLGAAVRAITATDTLARVRLGN